MKLKSAMEVSSTYILQALEWPETVKIWSATRFIYKFACWTYGLLIPTYNIANHRIQLENI